MCIRDRHMGVLGHHEAPAARSHQEALSAVGPAVENAVTVGVVGARDLERVDGRHLDLLGPSDHHLDVHVVAMGLVAGVLAQLGGVLHHVHKVAVAQVIAAAAQGDKVVLGDERRGGGAYQGYLAQVGGEDHGCLQRKVAMGCAYGTGSRVPADCSPLGRICRPRALWAAVPVLQ